MLSHLPDTNTRRSDAKVLKGKNCNKLVNKGRFKQIKCGLILTTNMSLMSLFTYYLGVQVYVQVPEEQTVLEFPYLLLHPNIF